MKLLIIDDEELLRLTSYDIIEDASLFAEEDIFTANDGVEGYKVYQEVHPDIILTDIRMPNMDGSELIKKIREKDQETEIIVMTGYADLDMAVEVIRQNVFELLRKPFQPPELVLSLQNVIHKIHSKEEILAMETRVQNSEKLASVGLLSAGVAHEINNPNTFIKGNLELLKKYMEIVKPHLEAAVAAGVEESQKINTVLSSYENTLDSALKGSQRIAKIVSSLLSFSRSSERKEHIKIQPASYFEEAVTLTQFRYKKHDFELHVAENLHEIPLNEQEYVQIIMNFIINGIDAIEEKLKGHGKGKLELTIKDDESKQVHTLIFKDNGSGMTEEVKKKIFDPFFTTKPQGKGTGLGLSMCFGIVRRVGGEIFCDSTIGQGTEFRIEIPWVHVK